MSKCGNFDNDILYSDCTYIDGDIYYYTRNNGFLCKTNLIDNESTIVFIPKKKYAVEHIICVDNVIYAAEIAGNKLLIYDIKNDIFEEKEIGCGVKEWGNILDIFEYDKNIYILPAYMDKLIQYNVETGILNKIDIKMEYNGKKRGIRIGDKLWVFFDDTSKVLVISLQNLKQETLSLESKLGKIMHLFFYKGCIYILNKDGIVIEYNITSRKQSIVMKSNQGCYSRIIITEKKMILLPLLQTGDIVIREFKSNNDIIYKDYPNDLCFEKLKWSLYMGYTSDDRNYYFAQRLSNMMLVINKNSGELKWRKNKNINEKKIEEGLMVRDIKTGSVLCENEKRKQRDYLLLLDYYK